VLRAEDGAVHIFPNGGILSLANLTREYSYYVFSISVDYKEDPARVTEVLKELGEKLMAEDPYHSVILAPLEVWGVDKLGDFEVVIKARFKTLPSQQWLVGREMNARILKRFGEAQIEMPFPTQTIQFAPDTWKPRRDELKQVVREVLKEESA
jgi:small conductance mechanosensitive channel